MVFSKVVGQKQTVLAASSKKTMLLADTPPARATVSPQHRPKQTATPTSSKTPTLLKQVTIKSALQHQLQSPQPQQQQSTPQKPIATSTPKAPSTKKIHESKASTSQQKPQQQQQLQQVEKKTPPPKKPETEPIRLNVRKTLAELLTTRIKEAKDLTITEEEISELALRIELEMYRFFKDTGAKYKAKYRSLVFNIKDTKNLTLFRKIAERSLSPDAVVKLSPEEMASQELAEWREKENKHQLDMIKKNELDLIAQAKSIVVKTHKGEQIIENEGAADRLDSKSSVQDIVSALNSGETISSTVEENEKLKEERLADELKKSKSLDEDKKKREKDRDREKRRGRSRDRSKEDSKRDRSINKIKHRHKDKDRSKERKSKKEAKHKDRERTRDKDHDKSSSSRDHERKKERKEKHKESRSSSRSKSRHKDHKEKHKREEDKKREEEKKREALPAPGLDNSKPIEDRLWRHIEDETTTNTLDGNESDVSDREPSSTVTIKTPDINEDLDRELDKELEKEPQPKSSDGSKGVTTVWRGFVYMPDVAKFFVTAQSVSGNAREIMEYLPDSFDVVGRINPITVWDYIGKTRKSATKEILVIKLTATNDEEKIPYITLYSYLNSRNRFGVLGNISPNIKDFYIMPFSNGSKLPSVLLPLDDPCFEENRQHLLLGIIVVHSRKKRPSCAPPPLTPAPKLAKKDHAQDKGFSSPPPPPPPLIQGPRDEDAASSPIQEGKQSLAVISKIVPELSSKIVLESSSSSDKMQLDDDDEPYSPGEPVDIVINDDEDALSSSSASLKPMDPALSPNKSSTELQRKMDELSRQIEEEKQQIQSISSSFLGDASTTLPVRVLPDGA